MVLRLFSSILIIVTCITGYSQNYTFNRLSISEGLLSNNVRALWQDPFGYLWLGTENGLQRYDGYRFRTIFNERVEQILADAQGRVFIRQGKRVGLFNPRTFVFTPKPYEDEETVVSPSKVWLQKDASGNVYIQLTGNYCQYFNPQKGGFSARYNPFRLPGHLKIFRVTEDLNKNRYWILSQEGLGYWDKKDRVYYSGNSQREPLLNNRTLDGLSDLFIDNKNNYWLQVHTGNTPRFFSFDGASDVFTNHAAKLNDAKPNYFEIYGRKQINDSVLAFYGLNYFRVRTGQYSVDLRSQSNDPYHIQFNSVSDVLCDREGIIWVATDNGLFYTSHIQSNVHIAFTQEEGRSSVSNLLEDDRQQFWIGTWGGGVFKTNKTDRDAQPVPVQQINDLDEFTKMTWTLCNDDQKNIWVGCEGGRLVRYNMQSDKATLIRPPVFRNSGVRQIVKHTDGLLWLGLQDGRIFTFDPSAHTFTDRSFKEVCALNGPVNKMLFVNDSHLWVAVNGKGISVIDAYGRKVIRSVYNHDRYTSNITNVRDILKYNDTVCFIAANQLGTINTRTFKVNFELPYHGSRVGSVYTLQKDNDQNCWIGGSNGIFKLNLRAKTLVQYAQQDGLITVHNNSYVPERSTRLASGKLAFGGNQHLVVFDPAQYNQSDAPANVIITGFRLHNRYLSQDSIDQLKEISIPYDQRAFTIEFAALSFKQKGKLFYTYKLEGIDKEWTSLNTSQVEYNFLPTGRYRFLVRANNEVGQYSPSTTSLLLYIRPPFWKTTWFYLLVGLVTASLLFYLHRVRLQKLLHVERVRSRLARDLHDDMGSTLSTINILSNMALQKKSLDEAESKAYMNTISTSTSQMMEAMDDIVWSINPANDSIAKIIARMKETAGGILEPRQIDYHFDVNPAVPEIKLSMEARREIFLIFKEALNNIIKYAACTKVEFTLTKKGPAFILIIKDDGTGFQMPLQQTAVRGNGLKNMEKRAANIEGQLSVDSQPGNGTTIRLLMPIA